MTYNQRGFAFTGLRTVNFATIEPTYKRAGGVNLMTGLGFGLDIDEHTISCRLRCAFEKKKDQPFIILEVQGYFEVEKDDFIKKVRQEDYSYLIPKVLAIHYAVLTVGSARGILHAKIENSLFNKYMLPTIDVKEMIPEDVILKI